MAGANLPAKKYSKTSPTTTRLSFEFTGGETQFIDIALALSAINRKFYRQGVYYYVNSIEVYNNEQGVVDLHTLPDNWITKNAWNRSFKYFQKMNAQTDFPRPKYHDFKVYMSDLHRTSGSAVPSLYGVNSVHTESTTTPDDWDYSQFVSSDSDGDIVVDPTAPSGFKVGQEADNFYIHMLGGHVGTSDNWTSIGAIYSYMVGRARQHATNPEVYSSGHDDVLINLFDMSTEEVINDLNERLDYDNDAPPYDNNNMVGSTANNMQHVARVGTEVGLGRVGRASGFCAPLGLICVDPQDISSDYRVVINLAQGTYHGVYAERA